MQLFRRGGKTAFGCYGPKAQELMDGRFHISVTLQSLSDFYRFSLIADDGRRLTDRRKGEKA